MSSLHTSDQWEYTFTYYSLPLPGMIAPRKLNSSSPHLFISPLVRVSNHRTLCLAEHGNEFLYLCIQRNLIKSKDIKFCTPYSKILSFRGSPGEKWQGQGLKSSFALTKERERGNIIHLRKKEKPSDRNEIANSKGNQSNRRKLTTTTIKDINGVMRRMLELFLYRYYTDGSPRMWHLGYNCKLSHS